MSCSQRSQSAARDVLGTARLRFEPRVDARRELVVAAQALREADVAEADVEARHELAQRPQALELGGPVQAVAGARALGLDEPGALDVAQHPRRPVRGLRSLVDRQGVHPEGTLPRSCQGLGRARYGLDWTRLAAIGAIESGHGQARVAGVLSGTKPDGASGLAQFLAGTWERFGVDGNGDGSRDPHDAADAIPAMASYLRASGAPQDWRAALRSDNHSDAYVDAVEKLASKLRSTFSA